MAGFPSQGGGGPKPKKHVKIKDQPIDVNIEDSIDLNIEQPVDVKIKNQPIDINIANEPIDVNVLNAINADITDRCSRLLGRLCFGGVAIDPRDRNWTLSSVTDSVSASISGTPDVNVTDRAARLLGIVYGSQGQQLVQDLFTTHLAIIETAHHEIHEGKLFNVSVVDTNVDIASPKRILLTTPNTAIRAHVVYEMQTEPGILFELFEGTTTTDDGTALSEICHRRANPNVATVVATEDPTVTADGTLLDTTRSGTSTAGGKIGGRIGRGSEFILAQNTKYQFKMTPLSNNTAVSIVIEWYEV